MSAASEVDGAAVPGQHSPQAGAEKALSLRPIGPDDMGLLYEIYASTRTEELAIVPWNDEQKAAFLQMQFTAQHRYYQATFPSAAFEIILCAGQPAGRLYVDRSGDNVHIIDIALLPPYRNAGIGSAFLKDLLAEGERTRKPVEIYVEKINRARRLYERLGFVTVADQGVYLRMKRYSN